MGLRRRNTHTSGKIRMDSAVTSVRFRGRPKAAPSFHRAVKRTRPFQKYASVRSGRFKSCRRQAQAAKTAALNGVLPAFDETAAETLTIDEMPITVYTATKGGQLAGYAVESMTKNGFGGAINMMVGFTPDGEVINVNVLKQAETPGLGTKMADADNVLLRSVKGQKLEEKKHVNGKLAVAKDGGDVDALTAATISSRAYVDAINRAWMAYKSVATGSTPTDVSSGATSAAGDTAEEQTSGPEAQEGGQNE